MYINTYIDMYVTVYTSLFKKYTETIKNFLRQGYKKKII